MAERVSAVDVSAALDRKYGQTAGSVQWVVIREARSGAGFDGNTRQCDYLAINTYKGRGLQLVGHEIKVSMADWRRELEEPEKAEAFARHCRRWWVVMPSRLAVKAKPDLPPTWGLMSVSESGRVTEVVKAPAREPAPVPVWWWIGWLAQVDRREKRAALAEVDALVRDRVEKEKAAWERSWQDRHARQLQLNDDLREKAEDLRRATGIDLRYAWTGSIAQLKTLWDLAQAHRNGADLEAVITRMRQAVELLEALIAEGVVSESQHRHRIEATP